MQVCPMQSREPRHAQRPLTAISAGREAGRRAGRRPSLALSLEEGPQPRHAGPPEAGDSKELVLPLEPGAGRRARRNLNFRWGDLYPTSACRTVSRLVPAAAGGSGPGLASHRLYGLFLWYFRLKIEAGWEVLERQERAGPGGLCGERHEPLGGRLGAGGAAP